MANPAAAVAAIRKDVNGSSGAAGTWTYVNITTQTTTLLKTGPGILHCIVVNKPTATTTIEVDDAVTHTSPIIGTITIPGGPTSCFSLEYDVEFVNGLSITTGTANSDITVAFC
jgi:hypothetical protein